MVTTRGFPGSAGSTRSTDHPPTHPAAPCQFDPRCAQSRDRDRRERDQKERRGRHRVRCRSLTIAAARGPTGAQHRHAVLGASAAALGAGRPPAPDRARRQEQDRGRDRPRNSAERQGHEGLEILGGPVSWSKAGTLHVPVRALRRWRRRFRADRVRCRSQDSDRFLERGVGVSQTEVGVEVRFHDLRHTCVTRMVKGGVPLSVVGSILGWSPADDRADGEEVRAHRACGDAGRGTSSRQSFAASSEAAAGSATPPSPG